MYRTLSRVSFVGLYIACVAVGWSMFSEADAEVSPASSQLIRLQDQRDTSAIENALMSVQSRNANLREENDFLRRSLRSDHVVDRIITIDESRKAYELLPPKLYMSVSNLQSGSQVVFFGNQTETLSVGQYVDLRYDGMDCYILLLESDFDKATFKLGCVPDDLRPRVDRADLTN